MRRNNKRYTRERIRKRLFENEPHLSIRRVEVKRQEDSEDIGVDVKFYEHPQDIWRIITELEYNEEWHTKLIHEKNGWVLKIVMEPQKKEQIYESGKEEIMRRFAKRTNRIGWREDTGEGAWYSQRLDKSEIEKEIEREMEEI